jgi:hypothetical protein
VKLRTRDEIYSFSLTICQQTSYAKEKKRFKILGKGMKMWLVKMTGEVKKWTVKRQFWSVIVRWPAVILSPDHLKWLNNFFYRILVTCFLFKIFNFVSYANITGVTSHYIMSFQKSIIFLTNTYVKNLKIAYVLICICINFITGN